MTKSDSYSLSSLVSSFDQEPVLTEIKSEYDVDSLLNQIKSLQDEVRCKSAELLDANQRIVALVGINKRISRRTTSLDESSSESGSPETFSSRLRTLGRSSKRFNLGKNNINPKLPPPPNPMNTITRGQKLGYAKKVLTKPYLFDSKTFSERHPLLPFNFHSYVMYYSNKCTISKFSKF